MSYLKTTNNDRKNKLIPTFSVLESSFNKPLSEHASDLHKKDNLRP